MPIAYLINQYPKVSHSFIRREIQALERLGIDVMRISIRGWNEPLVDVDDLEERTRTRYVLRDGALAMVLATLKLCLTHPIRFLRALALEIRMARRSDRPLPVHLIYLAEACRIFLWLKRAGVTHLHAHFGTNSAEVAMLIHVLGGPPWSFTVHGPEEFDKPFAIGLAEKIRRATFVVAISSYGRSQLYRLVDHRYWPRIHVVRCGLDRKFFDDVPDRPLSARRLVCVGRICEQKGQLLLLEAARILAAKGVDFELVLAGDGEMRREAEAFIEQHKLTSRVRITGWISNDQVREELLAARVLVLPSFAEGLPVVIMEAMALRRPVISTFVAGIPELVIPGEHGWLVPAGDVQSLVDTIQNCIIASDNELSMLGQAAHHRVKYYHDSDDEALKLQRLFTRLSYPANIKL
ncbi:glycosyltransferase [Bradyrhizobium sp. dw_78]|uniref:glycosyltransferase n=1 Tax=Bradyrhizobium sp. dw_78 TaxID=2719793 RepID=UPI001BD62DE4|nr:glycosyltransferase [Bradyrhizobium sp. dw_78]